MRRVARDRTRRNGIASLPALLDANPYQRLLYAELAPRGLKLVRTERLRLGWLWRVRRSLLVLHFHWPQPYFVHGSQSWLRGPLSAVRLGLFAVRLGSARLLGYRIVWTIHQIRPHESTVPRIDRLASMLLARASHVLLAHDHATIRAAEHALRLRAGRVELIQHGSYIGVYPSGRSRPEVRSALGIRSDAFVFLSLGLIRAYKDLDVLLAAFAAVDDRDATLIVAGSPVNEEIAKTVVSAAGRDARIKPLLEFVPNERLAELYAATDAAVLARGDGGTSGALILALSFGVPVVAARSETYTELLADGAAGWLFEPGSPASLSGILAAAAADRDAAAAKGAAALAQANALNWPEIAARFTELVLGAAGPVRGTERPNRSQAVD